MGKFARRIDKLARQRLRLLRDQADGLAMLDDEAVHEFRIGVRRLRALIAPWQAMTGFETLDKPLWRIKRIMAASSQLRDDTVQHTLLAALCPQPDTRLLAWIAARQHDRQRHADNLAAQLNRHPLQKATRQLGRRLETACAAHRGSALKAAIAAHEQMLRRRLQRGTHNEAAMFADADRWHAVRLDCKRWRYMLEAQTSLFGPNWQTARDVAQQAQDALGQLRDIELLAESLDQHQLIGTELATALLETRDLHLQAAKLATRDIAALLSAARPVDLPHASVPLVGAVMPLTERR